MDDQIIGEQPQGTTAKQAGELGKYLRDARMALGLSLRDVEEATGHEVSNAYLSQLETAKVKKPSPHVLYALSLALSVLYDELMQRAGYIVPQDRRTDVAKHGRTATYSIENLSADEEEALREHLAYLRWRRRK
ncbi:MAG: helix-turn-helix transcriptional regulator [Gammaproteobacteria bacterium]|nr:helix-turn-helix transcriptional regulator [Gammaproteobacteria bacterium]